MTAATNRNSYGVGKAPFWRESPENTGEHLKKQRIFRWLAFVCSQTTKPEEPDTRV